MVYIRGKPNKGQTLVKGKQFAKGEPKSWPDCSLCNCRKILLALCHLLSENGFMRRGFF
jgi:hypothetical protein